jgi:hypothetical protein
VDTTTPPPPMNSHRKPVNTFGLLLVLTFLNPYTKVTLNIVSCLKYIRYTSIAKVVPSLFS